jgi:hypothetical protein
VHLILNAQVLAVPFATFAYPLFWLWFVWSEWLCFRPFYSGLPTKLNPYYLEGFITANCVYDSLIVVLFIFIQFRDGGRKHLAMVGTLLVSGTYFVLGFQYFIFWTRLSIDLVVLVFCAHVHQQG